MNTSFCLPTLALAVALSAPLPVGAQSVRPSDVVEGQFRSGWRAPDGTQIAGFQLNLAQDWMTYWRHPGESGIAPQIDWSGSQNLADLRVHWPEPRLYLKAGFNSIGYKNEVVFPVALTPLDPAKPITLRATLSIGVCADICIPVDLRFDTVIEGDGRLDRKIDAAMLSAPSTARQKGLRDITCALHPRDKGAVFQVDMTLPRTGQREFALVEIAGTNVPSRSMPTTRAQGILTGQTYFRAKDGRLPAIDRSGVQVTVVSENGATQHRGCTVVR